MTAEMQRLRRMAVSRSLFPPASLKSAFDKLGFVQADPIRSPARAQDLILRQRVRGYHAGDLERRYSTLDIEEDFLYAYGFLTREIWQAMHPRRPSGLSALEKKVLEAVRAAGQIHPSEMEAHFGRKRVINAWGGYSKATTHALDGLHHRGLLRIAGRRQGIRIYEIAPSVTDPPAPAERLRRLIMAVARILAPVTRRTLTALSTRFRRFGETRAGVKRLVESGELRETVAGGVSYLWPPGRAPREEQKRVRFLAPFDPVVWERQRFEHFWGWAYRFEAYTPVAKRVRGYYAMPLLWGDDVIGWVNAHAAGGKLNLTPGFVGKAPAEPEFRVEMERETASLEEFLKPVDARG